MDDINSLRAMPENSDRVCASPTLLCDQIAPRWRVEKRDLEDRITPVAIGLRVRSDRPLTRAGRCFADAVALQAKALIENTDQRI